MGVAFVEHGCLPHGCGSQAPREGFTASRDTQTRPPHKGRSTGATRVLDVFLPEFGDAVARVKLVGLEAKFIVGDFGRLVALQYFQR